MEKLFWTTLLLLSGRLLPADQGIEGIVYPVSGNRMPSPDHKTSPPRGIKSTVYIFELTNITQVTRQGQSSYYPVINTRLVKQADTDDTGYFKIKLPPGFYSIFTRKGDLFYASRRDEKNNIAPVEVMAGKFTRIDCKIEGDRKAVY
ncbi:MAG TPA: hypothetical protein VNS58_13080 [Puia sp.]|jgi:hypothetical protein|nr:hypothetical protein [Puia sp.]